MIIPIAFPSCVCTLTRLRCTAGAYGRRGWAGAAAAGGACNKFDLFLAVQRSKIKVQGSKINRHLSPYAKTVSLSGTIAGFLAYSNLWLHYDDTVTNDKTTVPLRSVLQNVEKSKIVLLVSHIKSLFKGWRGLFHPTVRRSSLFLLLIIIVSHRSRDDPSRETGVV